MGHLTVEGERLNGPMGPQQNGAARGLVAAARLHSNITVLHQVEPADAMTATKTIELGEQLVGLHLLAVDGCEVALDEVELDLLGLAGCLFDRHGQAPHAAGWGLAARVLEQAPLIRNVQQVGVHGEGRLALAFLVVHRNAVLVGVGEQFVAGEEIPFPPGCDDLDIGHEGVGAEFKAHLVISFAGGPVGDGIGLLLAGDLDQPLGNEGPCNGGAQQVLALIDGVGPKHREDEVSDEFLAEVFDVDLLHTKLFGLLPGGLKLLALADVGGEGDDLAAVLVLQPLEDDRGVESTGVGQHNFLDLGVCHVVSCARGG